MKSVAVTGVTATVGEGQTATLVATATLSDGTTSIVTTQAIWSSSNTTTATVSAAGVVAFLAPGDVDITARYQNVSGSTHVSVSASVPIVTAVAITGGVSTATVGQTTSLTATAMFSNNTNQDVTSQATWDTTNAAVATVSNTGFVNFVGVGEVDLKATFQGARGSTHVVVEAAAPPPPNVTAFYGTYIVNLAIVNQMCSDPFIPPVPWTGKIELSGQSDGSGFTAKITERDQIRPYTGGTMSTNGSFTGFFKGLLLFSSVGARPLDAVSRPLHDVNGPIAGSVNGSRITGQESLAYTLGCTDPGGGSITISFDGTK